MTTIAPTTSAPWLRIWTHPRVTIREQLARGSSAAVWIIPLFSGIAQTLVRVADRDLGLRASAGMILVLAIPIGAIWGVVQLYILAGLLYLVERANKGRATFGQLRIALAWAAVPQVVVVAIWIIGTLLAGRFLYMDPDRAVASGAGWTVLTIAFTNLASAVCAIWWLVLSVFTVAEAQGGSAWRALGTMILAALILGVVALLAIVVVVALSHP